MREGRPSETALTIARGTVFWSEDREIAQLIPEGATEASRWFVEESHATIPRMRSLALAVERVLLPGISIHYLLRKRWIEKKVREAIASGFRRVGILAGGFDTLALRLHREFPDVQFTEFDHPATQSVKRRALERHGAIGENLVLQPIDLSRQPLIRPSGTFSPQAGRRAIFWVAEGLLMYLPEEAVTKVFRDIAAETSGRFLFSFLDTSEFYVNAVRRTFINALLHLRGEPLRWHIDKELIESWLKRIDFRSLDMATPAQLRGRYLSPEIDRRLNPPSGDVLCLSEW